MIETLRKLNHGSKDNLLFYINKIMPTSGYTELRKADKILNSIMRGFKTRTPKELCLILFCVSDCFHCIPCLCKNQFSVSVSTNPHTFNTYLLWMPLPRFDLSALTLNRNSYVPVFVMTFSSPSPVSGELPTQEKNQVGKYSKQTQVRAQSPLLITADGSSGLQATGDSQSLF